MFNFNFFLILFGLILALWDLIQGNKYDQFLNNFGTLRLGFFSRLLRFLYRFFLRCHIKCVCLLGKWVPNSFFVILNEIKLVLWGENVGYTYSDDWYVLFYYNGEFICKATYYEYESLMNSFFASPFDRESDLLPFHLHVHEWMLNQRTPQSVDLWEWRDTFHNVDDFWEAAVYVSFPYIDLWVEDLLKKLKWFSLGGKVSQFAFESLCRYSCFLPKPNMKSLFFQFLLSICGLCFFFLRKFFLIPSFFVLLIIFCYLIFLFFRYFGNFLSFVKSASFRLILNYILLFIFPFLSGFLGLAYFVFRYLKEVFWYVYYYFFMVDSYEELKNEKNRF